MKGGCGRPGSASAMGVAGVRVELGGRLGSAWECDFLRGGGLLSWFPWPCPLLASAARPKAVPRLVAISPPFPLPPPFALSAAYLKRDAPVLCHLLYNLKVPSGPKRSFPLQISLASRHPHIHSIIKPSNHQYNSASFSFRSSSQITKHRPQLRCPSFGLRPATASRTSPPTATMKFVFSLALLLASIVAAVPVRTFIPRLLNPFLSARGPFRGGVYDA
ncbi:hypothetical protein GQ53DRAFT_30774 [Thozetella sp. PMI_491]|nr:hypothetical protein GQ53DRAFT_30774 [Thozetella sp. PMI_491]